MGIPRMAVITLSASYGAGGSDVGPAVAERLGIPFVDRAIPTGVAERLAVPMREAVERDEAVGNWLTRALLSFGQVGPVLGGVAPHPSEVLTDEMFRHATEQVLREHASGAGAVILGRAGAVVLRGHPHALHVRLTGPQEARIAQGMRLEGGRPRDRRAPRASRPTGRGRPTCITTTARTRATPRSTTW